MQADHFEGGQRELVRKAQRALVAMILGDDSEALAALGQVGAPDAGRQDSAEERDAGDQDTVTDIRELMLLLFGACSAMVASLGDDGAAPVRVQVFDETGEEVSIDQAAPPVRTAVRTLLAEVHGNTDAAQEQVEIALANAVPDEVDSLVLQALRWTVRLAVECLERDLPVPGWVAEALTE